jgi:hypothetical protein
MAPRLHYETGSLPSPAALLVEGTTYDGLHYAPHDTAQCAAHHGAAVLADDPCMAGGGGGGPEQANQYYRARYYDPATGRFVSEDPIEFEAGVNFYAYVDDNPTTSTDPDGTDPWKATKIMWQKYKDMTTANTKKSDKHFHCMAQCEASREGRGAAWTAGMIGEGRELADQHVKGDTEWDCDDDRFANATGRTGDRNKPCREVCMVYRPRGLPPQY